MAHSIILKNFDAPDDLTKDEVKLWDEIINNHIAELKESDLIMLRMYVKLMIKCEGLDEEIQDEGYLDFKGRINPKFSAYTKLLSQAHKLASDLYLTPRARNSKNKNVTIANMNLGLSAEELQKKAAIIERSENK